MLLASVRAAVSMSMLYWLLSITEAELCFGVFKMLSYLVVTPFFNWFFHMHNVQRLGMANPPITTMLGLAGVSTCSI